MNEDHPVRFSVEYPDRPLDRLSTAFRIFTVIPIAIVIGSIGGYTGGGGYEGGDAPTIVIGGTGLLFLPPLLMILFREKYPRWWFDWNLELLRFTNRVGVYFALMDDRYPSTDEQQWVRLDFAYPDAKRDLNRWLPLVKWLLAIPHYIVLFFLYIGGVRRRDRRLVRDPVHGPLPARHLRLRRGRDPLAQPRRRLRLHPGHGPLSPVLAEPERGRPAAAAGAGAARTGIALLGASDGLAADRDEVLGVHQQAAVGRLVAALGQREDLVAALLPASLGGRAARAPSASGRSGSP